MKSTTVSRRGFMKVAGASTAGFTVLHGVNPFAYAANEIVRVGCIGTGGQGSFHITTGLAGNHDKIQIVAIADVFRKHQEDGTKLAWLANAGIMYDGSPLTDEQKAAARAALKPTPYYDYKEMLAKEELDAVVISTPLTTHYQITMDCLDAGKFVFCEKTLVKDVETGRALIKKCHDVGKWVQVGHQRRYNPKYNLAMKAAYEPVPDANWQLGRITHITAQWHRNNFWRRNIAEDYPGYEFNDMEKQFIHTDLERHLNWRMYMESSGGLFTELSTHQTDIANWFLRSVPVRVHAIGGIDYWRDGRDVDDNIVCTFEYRLKPNDPGFIEIERRNDMQKTADINKPYTVRFVYSSILANAKRGASELIQGDRGSFELTEDKCYMYGEPGWAADMKAKAEKVAKAKAAAEGAAAAEEPNADGLSKVTARKSLLASNKELLEGRELLGDRIIHPADVYQFQAFAHHIRNGGIPRNNQMVGYTTAITAMAAIESRKTGKPVDIDPAWYTFDFEVPSFYDYEYTDENYEKKPETAETQPA